MARTATATAAHTAAETHIRALLKDNGIDEPDQVEYAPSCLRLFWTDRKVAVVIDLDPGMPA